MTRSVGLAVNGVRLLKWWTDYSEKPVTVVSVYPGAWSRLVTRFMERTSTRRTWDLCRFQIAYLTLSVGSWLRRTPAAGNSTNTRGVQRVLSLATFWWENVTGFNNRFLLEFV